MASAGVPGGVPMAGGERPLLVRWPGVTSCWERRVPARGWAGVESRAGPGQERPRRGRSGGCSSSWGREACWGTLVTASGSSRSTRAGSLGRCGGCAWVVWSPRGRAPLVQQSWPGHLREQGAAGARAWRDFQGVGNLLVERPVDLAPEAGQGRRSPRDRWPKRPALRWEVRRGVLAGCPWRSGLARLHGPKGWRCASGRGSPLGRRPRRQCP